MDLNVSKYQIKEELHKQWTQQAVELAMRGSWDEAAQANLRILESYPQDIRARNRLGKAYSELGRHEEALQTYEECLKAQPSNNIARRRLADLYALLHREPATPLGETIPTLEMAEGDDDEIEELDTYLDEDEPEGGVEEEATESD